ncbi:hypothetical protein K469DRAFT_693482 [Zopfia rhizophila CBS 207.26]|uniref:Uncharacterized protein n=1 Tax=Zopfia rhizophila CBS 207.26 TaxID=1314779 RepID=A0A6A6DNP0_9PEZI|nr:hypothetical protein K469DRAFT_693482 [Zopfia rhizophila CBS 207.26]
MDLHKLRTKSDKIRAPNTETKRDQPQLRPQSNHLRYHADGRNRDTDPFPPVQALPPNQEEWDNNDFFICPLVLVYHLCIILRRLQIVVVRARLPVRHTARFCTIPRHLEMAVSDTGPQRESLQMEARGVNLGVYVNAVDEEGASGVAASVSYVSGVHLPKLGVYPPNLGGPPAKF